MELPIFPLNGAVLFPGTSLPLNIFEQRYLDMVDYSLARERLIGMIQTNDKDELYSIGCIGKVHSFNETNDGRYLISLQGINCFKIINELEPSLAFRLVDAEIVENYDDKNNFIENQKANLLKKYKEYIKIKNINLSVKEIEGIEMGQLVKFIAMVSPFNNIDKQALLEAKTSMEFYNKLKSIIELEIAGNFQNNTIN